MTRNHFVANLMEITCQLFTLFISLLSVVVGFGYFAV